MPPPLAHPNHANADPTQADTCPTRSTQPPTRSSVATSPKFCFITGGLVPHGGVRAGTSVRVHAWARAVANLPAAAGVRAHMSARTRYAPKFAACAAHARHVGDAPRYRVRLCACMLCVPTLAAHASNRVGGWRRAAGARAEECWNHQILWCGRNDTGGTELCLMCKTFGHAKQVAKTKLIGIRPIGNM
jgi:hypothetical protein